METNPLYVTDIFKRYPAALLERIGGLVLRRATLFKRFLHALLKEITVMLPWAKETD
jgi:hypothetical protein